MRTVLTGLLAGGLLCAPATAGAQEWAQSYDAMQARLVEVGTWEFQATRRGPDGQPECVESWTFNADGSGLIVSGEQHVTFRWHTSRHEGIGQLLFMPRVSSTEGPDCMGREVDTSDYPRTSWGYQLLFYDDGMGALICVEGQEFTRPDGSRFRRLEPEDCWGRIVASVEG